MSKITRRELLKWGLMGTGAMVLAACAPAKPTAAPAAPKPAKPVAAAPEKKEEVITLRFLTRQGPKGIHMREFAKRFSHESGGKIAVETEEVPWGEVPKTLETQYITGTMVDLTWGDNAWWPRLAVIGAFLVIEPYVEAIGMDLSKWFNIDRFRIWTNGKLSGLGGCAGANALLTFYNKEWVKAAWGKEPWDDWTIDDWTEMMTACVEHKGGKGKGFFGEIPATAGGHGSHGYYCRWGGRYLSKDGKKSVFNEEKCQDGIKHTMAGLKSGIFAAREDAAEGSFKMFMAGKLCSLTSNPGASDGMVKGAEENNIDMGVSLGPCGPACLPPQNERVFNPYTNTFGCYAKTKYPQEAFDLMVRVSSAECMKWLCLTTGKQPGAQLDAWRDPEIAAKFPWFPKVADLLEACKDVFPTPANTRYNEWKDVGNQEIPGLIFGDIPYNQSNIDTINDHLQEILDLPSPPKPQI